MIDAIANAQFIHSLPGAQRQGHEHIYRFGNVVLDAMWTDGVGGSMIKIDMLKAKSMTEGQVKQVIELLGGDVSRE